MQQKTWVWIIIAVVVIAAIGFFVYQNGGGASLATLGNTSLRTLLTSNASQKCTFNNGQSSGTIYVSAGRMRGDFSAKTGGTAQSHMIITNDIAYVWIDGMNQGYRMPFEDLTATSSAKNSQGVDADARVATNCGAWSATDSSFSLPTNVSFNPVGAPTGDMTPTIPSTGTQTGASTGASASTNTSTQSPQTYYAQQCAACNAITDKNAKAQCIASFDCPNK